MRKRDEVEFERLFTISAFEGLRLLREIQATVPDMPIADCVEPLRTRSGFANALDIEASLYLHDLIRVNAPHDSVLFYRECVMAVMVSKMPAWAKLMTLGRGRWIRGLKGEEYRDFRSVFRESRLLDEPPTSEDVRWWDILSTHVRLNRSDEALLRSREAERLSLEREAEELKAMGITMVPKWVAIDDNTVGYDVLSYRYLHGSLANLLIEVKSTVASPSRFIVSRNEWNVADQAGDAYVFHIWDMTKEPPILHIRTVEQVRPHIPHDNEKGKWKDAEILL
jgi:hypothetical protein